MRRKDRKIESIEEINNLISKAQVIRLGLSVDNTPYIVPLNFGYDGHAFYMHCAKEGRKIDMIQKNPRVCFEIDGGHELEEGEIACKYTMHYHSIIGYGNAEIVLDRSEKIKGLDVIMAQFADQTFEYAEGAVDRIAIIKVTVDEISGKKSK